jgi:hypothetical protein
VFNPTKILLHPNYFLWKSLTLTPNPCRSSLSGAACTPQEIFPPLRYVYTLRFVRPILHIIVFCVRKVFNNFTTEEKSLNREKKKFLLQIFLPNLWIARRWREYSRQVIYIQRTKSARQIAACKRTFKKWKSALAYPIRNVQLSETERNNITPLQ